MVQVVIGEQRGEGVRCDLSPNPDPYATPPPNSPPPRLPILESWIAQHGMSDVLGP